MSSASTPHPQPRLLSLAWPLFTELGLGIAIGLLGTALAAAISDTAGAAFALANHVSAMLFILFRIIGAGVSVVLTQSLGAGRRDAADAVARAVLGASSWIGAFSASVALLFAGPLLRLLNAPPEVLPLAQPFLQALAPALLLDAWNASMSSVMRAHLRSREALAVVVVMHSVHLLLAWPLMQGWGPLPALGLPGFAVALGLSRAVGLSLHLMLWRGAPGSGGRSAAIGGGSRAGSCRRSCTSACPARPRTSLTAWPSWSAWRWPRSGAPGPWPPMRTCRS